MQKSGRNVLKSFLILASLLVFSCQSELEKYYELPEWLKGNAYQLLESKGNFTQFLEAVELAGFQDVISGKGIITIMAPTDEAFTAYLSKKGYASVKDIPIDELKKLVGFHFVYYAYDKSRFANYRPEGISDNTVFSDAGLYYKFRTKSSSPIETVTDLTTAPGQDPQQVNVYHKERFLPVLSSYLFETKQIEAARNYQYFYPNTTWDGDNGGFCVSNANVLDYQLVTDNGYVYTLNKVLDPLETIHTELETIEDFSLFRQLYDKFQDFQLDDDLTLEYGNGQNLYLYYHTDLPKISSEWTYNGEDSYPDYADLSTLGRKAYNLFAPTNQSLTTFFNEFWKDYYNSITDISFLPIKYLLDNHVYEGDIVFPEEIEKGKIKTKFGNAIQFNTSDVSVKTLCVNGTLYGLNNLMVPSMYQSVTGPLFQDPNYMMLLYMVDKTELMLSLASSEVSFNFFLPSDRVIQQNTTIGGSGLLYSNGNPNKFGEQSVDIESDAGYSPMSYSAMNNFVKNHISSKLMTTVGNQKVYKTLNSFQYLLIEDDSKAYSSDVYNNYHSTPSIIASTSTWSNGKSYKIDSEDSKSLVMDLSLFKDQITKNTPEGFEKFKDLVELSQLHLQTPSFSFLQGNRYIVLVPTNEAIEAGMSSIPTESAETMANYLKSYFIDVTKSGFNDYPFPGAGIQGELTTFFKTETNEWAKLTLIDTGTGLQIKDSKGNVVNVVGVFPRIYSDGAAYVIDGLLQ